MENAIQITPVLDAKVRALCFKPYPLHQNGCPNYNRRLSCPPKCRLIQDIFDLEKPVFAVYNIFDMKAHVDRMRAKHPQWSTRQLNCVLYWQGGARKKLKENVKAFLEANHGYFPSYCPEACGVNVTQTMANVGIILEWPPLNKAYQIAFLGILKRKTVDEKSG